MKITTLHIGSSVGASFTAAVAATYWTPYNTFLQVWFCLMAIALLAVAAIMAFAFFNQKDERLDDKRNSRY